MGTQRKVWSSYTCTDLNREIGNRMFCIFKETSKERSAFQTAEKL